MKLNLICKTCKELETSDNPASKKMFKVSKIIPEKILLSFTAIILSDLNFFVRPIVSI